MSETKQATPQPAPQSQKLPPRVVVELLPNGDFVVETIINGARQRVPLNRGEEWWEVRDILLRMRRGAEAHPVKKWVPSEYVRVGKNGAGKIKAPQKAPSAPKAARKIKAKSATPPAAAPGRVILTADELF